MSEAIKAEMSDEEKSRWGAIAAVMAASQDKALAPPDGCGHHMQIRWKEGKAVCLICRTILDVDANWGLLLKGA